MLQPSLPTLVTHSGKFHCDEVFAYAALRLALGVAAPGEDHVLVRTRDPERIRGGTVVWDVGGLYDPGINRFDHHQRGAPVRPDGTPFSAAGLVWQAYGVRAIAALLPPEAQLHAGVIAEELDRTVLIRIDEVDNGVSTHGPLVDDVLSLSALISDHNPSWDAPEGDEHAAFMAAAEMAEDVLRRRVESLRARHAADAVVLAAHAAGEDAQILVLDRGMPWKSAVFAHGLPVMFTVSPASNGNWMVDTMPPEPGSFAQRLPLPEHWAGLEGAALAAASGVPDAVFTHLRRFVGAARTREGAVAMARKALGHG